MTATRNKRRGAEAEIAVMDWFSEKGEVAVRPRLNGRTDLGDVHVFFPGVTWVIECKRTSERVGTLAAWVGELRRECDNVRALSNRTVIGWLVVIGKGDLRHPHRWAWIAEEAPL